MHPDLPLDDFSVNFNFKDNSQLEIIGETPRFTIRRYGLGSESQVAADKKFMVDEIYRDRRVMSQYADGTTYPTLDAAVEKVNQRADMFFERAQRTQNHTPFGGYIVESKATNKPIAFFNIGTQGFEINNATKGRDTAEFAMLIPRAYQGKYFGTELTFFMKFMLIPAIIGKGYKTLGGEEFKFLAFTSKNSIPKALGLEPVKEQDLEQIGATRGNTIDKYGPNSRDFYHVPTSELQKPLKPR